MGRGPLGTVLVAAVVLSGGAAFGAGPETDSRKGGVIARGSYLGAGCVPTALSAAGDGAISCSGVSAYNGFFTTANPFTVTARVEVDTATGEVTATGVVDEWHYGRAADGSAGAMRTFQTFTQYADGTADFQGCVLEGTGEWSGASGALTATGWQGVAAVGAQGGYIFRWAREGSPQARAKCAREKARAVAELRRAG